VAGIGVVIGGGYVAAGIGFTVIVLTMLVGVRSVEQWAQGPCRAAHLRIVARSEGGKSQMLIRCRLEESSARIDRQTENPAKGTIEMMLTYCRSHRHHQTFVKEVAGMPAVI